jgi:GNAT superfamily N-acetyltransferase
VDSSGDLGPNDDVLGGLLGADAHAGHGHDDPLRPVSDVSVRPALPEDAALLGDLHARTLRATLPAGTGAELTPQVAAAIDPAALAAAWSGAISSPPSPGHRVLSALAGGRVVGFAAFAPATAAVVPDVVSGPEDPDTGSTADAHLPAPSGPVAEILALEVPAAHARQGHGSRLLAACADLLREQGVSRVQVWAVDGDESRARFLAQAGFAPAGLRRRLAVGDAQVVESCWYADL